MPSHDRTPRPGTASRQGGAGPDEATHLSTVVGEEQATTVRVPGEDGSSPIDDNSAFARRIASYRPVPGAGGRIELVGGRYRLMNEIGAGSMGRIFLAEQVSVGRRVALKIINAELAATSDIIARFQQEARLLASVRNEHIVDIYDIGQTDKGDPFIAMEYVDGPSLAHLLRDQGPLDAVRVIRLLLQVASALATVHAAGVVHRDLKPANIVILTRKDGVEIAKILDFGLAKVVHDRETTGRLTRAGVIIGTPEYMSPEQVNAGHVDHRADIYAIGCTAYEMLCGRPPFMGPEMSTLYKHMHEEAPPLRDLLPVGAEVPEALIKVVNRCLAKEPAARYGSARELHTALVVAADQAGIPRAQLRIPRSSLEDPTEAPVAPMVAPPPRAGSLETWLAVAVAAVLGIIIGIFLARSTGAGGAAGGSGAHGQLVVSSEPPGARVLVDGKAIEGLTPLVLRELPVGTHTVAIEARGYVRVEQPVTVRAGAASELRVPLARPRYTMRLGSEPSGATVTVDGAEVGHTPLSLDLTAQEFHEIILRREGFQAHQVLLAPEQKLEALQVTLQPVLLQAGTLVVESQVAGRVFVDGKDTGQWTPTADLQLPPGSHLVEVVDPMGLRRGVRVTIEQGQVSEVSIGPDVPPAR